MDIYLKKKKLMTLGLERHRIKISIVNQINATSRQCVHKTAYAQILVMEGQKKMNWGNRAI